VGLGVLAGAARAISADVRSGHPGLCSQVSFVEVDNEMGAYTAVTHLVRLGRRRIALITGPSTSL